MVRAVSYIDAGRLMVGTRRIQQRPRSNHLTGQLVATIQKHSRGYFVRTSP